MGSPSNQGLVNVALPLPNRGCPDNLQTVPMFESEATIAAAALVETAASLHGSMIDLEDLVG